MSNNLTYYAVKKGNQPGIYNSWDECKTAVTGFSQPIFRKFSTFEEASEFYNSKIMISSKPSIFKKSKSIDDFLQEPGIVKPINLESLSLHEPLAIKPVSIDSLYAKY